MRRALVRRVVVAAVLAAVGFSACGDSGGDETGGGSLAVVTPFYPVFEAARQVGGDLVEVTNLTPAGAEPHDLELSPRQVDTVLDADLAVVMGNGFQPAVEDIAEDRDGETLEVLAALPIDAEGKRVEDDEHAHDEEGQDEHADEAEGEDQHADEAEGEDQHADEAEGEDEHADDGDGDASEANVLDPHVWLDPVLYGDIVEAVAGELARVDPDNADAYRENASAYRDEVDALDAEFLESLNTCDRDVIVTSHDAFGWLAERYGLTQEGIAGLSPDAEPDARRLAELADLAEREGVTTIFTETLVSPEIAETLAREAGGLQTAVLNPLEGLSEEELAAGDDYLSVMRTNLEALRAALGCD
jgi:zinc transport system substrate-binding protein